MNALLALGMGGPENIEAIEPFLTRLLSDRALINFGIGELPQRILAKIIAKLRSKQTAPMYERMGSGSPHHTIIKRLLDKLPLDVYIGYCYAPPFIEDAVRYLIAADDKERYDNLYILPLYPEYSKLTSGICLSRAHISLKNYNGVANIQEIRSFHNFEPYLKCLAKRITSTELDIRTSHVLFSAHSIPQIIVDEGDIYSAQVSEQARLIATLAGVANYSIAYQSKMGRGKWLSPSLKDELKRLSEVGIRNVIICPLSFIADNIETLIEIDESALAYAHVLGLNVVRTASLNDSDDFADALGGLLNGAHSEYS
ncbi:ferrochelatase [Deferribacterales bacterium RsTz2092]